MFQKFSKVFSLEATQVKILAFKKEPGVGERSTKLGVGKGVSAWIIAAG
jgi:hypothetical protein